MAVTAYVQPKFWLNHVGAKLVNMSSDTFKIGLIASGTLSSRANTEGYEFVSDLLANSPGSALTEVSGGNYSRLSLTGLSWTASGLVVTMTGTSPQWASASFTTVYGWLHDETASSATDATRPLVLIWDFGGSFSPSSVNFILSVNASGLLTATAAV